LSRLNTLNRKGRVMRGNGLLLIGGHMWGC
jgi:hypothetical protein